MLFHVTTTVRMPRDVEPDTVKRLGEEEHERAAQLQSEGSGCQRANVSILKVRDPGELHEVLESLPLRPFMETSVVALCRHPGSLAATE